MDRRRFFKSSQQVLLALGLAPFSRLQQKMRLEIPSETGSITEIAGLKVGHFTHPQRPTGCTVVLPEEGAVGGVDVRGGAPGTRETDLLDPVCTVEKVHAIVLSGGSAFGLDAATGVVRYLEEAGIGFDVGVARVPIVPAAILFDLRLGDPRIRPDATAGYQACINATGEPVVEGSVGAGAGATVGKMLGMEWAMKAGIGTACLTVLEGLKVAALVAVNAVGDVYNPANGQILAGARNPHGPGFARVVEQIQRSGRTGPQVPANNTTIGVVATNAVLTKTQVNRLAQISHDGLARTINPVHSPFDGDTLFALATGSYQGETNFGVITILAAQAVARAVVRAVTQARGLPGLPAYQDISR